MRPCAHKYEEEMKMKKCPSCGHELSDSAAFCGNCGATVKAEQQPAEKAPAKVKLGGKKMMTIGIAAVAVILIAALCITLIPTVFATPAKTFATTHRKALIDPVLDAITTAQEKVSSQKISTDLTITAEVGGDDIPEEVEDLLKESSIVLKVNADNKSVLLNADIINDEEALLSAIFSYAEGKLGLSFPEIDDNAYFLSIDEFIQEKTDSEISFTELMDYQFDAKTFRSIADRYVDIIFSAVNKDSVEKEEDDVRLEMLDEKIECTVYTWTPEAEAIEEMLLKLAEELEGDEELRDFYLSLFNENMLSAVANFGGVERDLDDMEEIYDDFIEEAVENLEDNAEEIAETIEDADIKWVLALEGKQIRMIKISVGDEGTIAFECCGKPSEGVEQVFYVSTNDEPVFIISYEYEEDGSELDGKITFNDGWDDLEFSFKIDQKKASVLGINYGEYKISGSMIDDLTIKMEVEETKGGADHIISLRDMYYYTDGAFDKLDITINASEKGSAEDHSGDEEDITEYDEDELYELFEEIGELIFDDLEGIAFGKADTSVSAAPATGK